MNIAKPPYSAASADPEALCDGGQQAAVIQIATATAVAFFVFATVACQHRTAVRVSHPSSHSTVDWVAAANEKEAAMVYCSNIVQHLASTDVCVQCVIQVADGNSLVRWEHDSARTIAAALWTGSSLCLRHCN